MNKVIMILASATLVACGSDKENKVQVNTSEQSSVVATTNPNHDSQNQNSSQSTNQSADDGDITTIEYIETKHDFGNVFYPSENKYTFKFKNTGNFPLIIKEATASCGCTIPNKPEKPIMPGEIGELDVIFRPKEGQIGQPVTKTITVVANTAPEESFLEISANVLEGL